MIECPICGEYSFEKDNDFDVCPVCEWENDSVQLDDPTYWGGASDLCLNDYKKEWESVQHDRLSKVLNAQMNARRG